MTNKIVNDLSTITGIKEDAIERLVVRTEDCICHCVLESMVSREPLSEVDIGIGTLYIKREEEKVRYKFIPSQNFEEKVRTTIKERKSPLIKRAENKLKSKIEGAYKDLL